MTAPVTNASPLGAAPPTVRNWQRAALVTNPAMRQAVARCEELTRAPSLIGRETLTQSEPA
jgi:hypothetical protein